MAVCMQVKARRDMIRTLATVNIVRIGFIIVEFETSRHTIEKHETDDDSREEEWQAANIADRHEGRGDAQCVDDGATEVVRQ